MLKYVHTVQYSIDKKIIESRIVLARGRLGYIEWLSKTLKYPSPCPIPAAFFYANVGSTGREAGSAKTIHLEGEGVRPLKLLS